MAIQPTPRRIPQQEHGKPAKAVLLDTATNEVVFAVVGYVGSGTSEIATALQGLLKQERLEGGKFDVEILKARKVISDWAARNGHQSPATPASNLDTTSAFQDLGDKMRSAGDHAIVARELIQQIRLTRATKLGITNPGKEIVVKDQFAQSKLAWKAAVLQQVLLYRCVGVASGCAQMWNFGNVLCSVLAARALLETIALALDFEKNLQNHVSTKDFEKMDELITLHTFSTRSENMLAEKPELKAENVLNHIDRLEKTMPGIRGHYDFLSEWCHPNSAGHYFTFASLDRSTGTVSLSDRKLYGKDLLNAILGVYLMLGLIESAMERLDSLIGTIAQVHSAAHPV